MTKYLILSSLLFSIGVCGVISRRNILIILMSLELMLNAVNLSLVTFSRYRLDLQGQIFFLMILGVAAAEVAVGLSILIALFRTKKSVDTIDASILKE